MTAQSKPEINCPQCQSPISADSNRPGESVVKCPECGHSISDFSLSAPKTLFDDLFESVDVVASEAEMSSTIKTDDADSKAEEQVANQFESYDVEAIVANHDQPPSAQQFLAAQLANLNKQQAKPEQPPASDSKNQEGKATSRKSQEARSSSVAAKPKKENFRTENETSETNPVRPRQPVPPVVTPNEEEPSANAPGSLKIDGLTIAPESTRVFGVACRVCDTRIHANMTNVGQHIECPICYTKVKVIAPDTSKFDWGKQNADAVEEDGSELKLSEPVERPPIPIPEGFGLAPEEEDLLAPRPAALPPQDLSSFVHDDIPAMEIVSDDQLASENAGLETDGKSKPNARHQVSSDTQPRPGQETLEAGSSPASSRGADVQAAKQPIPTVAQGTPRAESERKSSRRQAFESSAGSEEESNTIFEIADRDKEDLDFKPFTPQHLNQRLITALTSPGILWRTAIAIVLLGLGAVAYSFAWSLNNSDESLDASGYGSLFLLYTGFAFFWLSGSVGMLYIASMLFRDSALGKEQIKKWSASGLEDIKSTLLLFGFSFVVAGSPLIGIWLLTGVSLAGPFRIMVAPLLLLSAWYNRSPWMCLSIDVFQNFSSQLNNWGWFYIYTLIFAVLYWIAGLLYWVPFFPLFFMAAAIQALATCAFAVLTGWHVGRLVADLERRGGSS